MPWIDLLLRPKSFAMGCDAMETKLAPEDQLALAPPPLLAPVVEWSPLVPIATSIATSLVAVRGSIRFDRCHRLLYSLVWE